MFSKKLKLTVVLFVLAAFLVVPTSTIFSARHLDKLCTNLKRTYKDGETEVTGGCKNYDEDECNSKSLNKTVTDGKCDIDGKGYVCVTFTVYSESNGTINCKWVKANPDGLPTKGYCGESSTTTSDYTDCTEQEDM